MKFIIEINDEQGAKGRKVYLTSWGTSAWKIHAKSFENKSDAETALSKYLKENISEPGRVLSYEA